MRGPLGYILVIVLLVILMTNPFKDSFRSTKGKELQADVCDGGSVSCESVSSDTCVLGIAPPCENVGRCTGPANDCDSVIAEAWIPS